MKLRDVYLLNGQTLNDSDTVTFSLTKALKILYLRVIYSNKNGATSNTLGALNSMVSKLQVVDGSSVLHSLSFREEQALNYFNYNHLPAQTLTQAAAGVVTEEAIIDFRRYPGDVNFYLDTSKYTNPQLSFTHSFTISATAGFATGQGKLTVIAKVIDSGAPSQLGFTMAKELDSFATAASGDHNTDLPLDFPLAALLVQNRVDASLPTATLSNFKLTADTDSFIPVNEAISDLLNRNVYEYMQTDQSIVLLNSTTYSQNSDLFEQVQAYMGPAGATAKAIVTTLTANQAAGAGTTGETGAVQLNVSGWAPHSSVYYKFGDGENPDQIFSPQGVGKLQLKLTQAGTGATAKVVTVQQHP